jgi:hypothetical protein
MHLAPTGPPLTATTEETTMLGPVAIARVLIGMINPATTDPVATARRLIAMQTVLGLVAMISQPTIGAINGPTTAPASTVTNHAQTARPLTVTTDLMATARHSNEMISGAKTDHALTAMNHVATGPRLTATTDHVLTAMNHVQTDLLLTATTEKAMNRGHDLTATTDLMATARHSNEMISGARTARALTATNRAQTDLLLTATTEKAMSRGHDLTVTTDLMATVQHSNGMISGAKTARALTATNRAQTAPPLTATTDHVLTAMNHVATDLRLIVTKTGRTTGLVSSEITTNRALVLTATTAPVATARRLNAETITGVMKTANRARPAVTQAMARPGALAATKPRRTTNWEPFEMDYRLKVGPGLAKQQTKKRAAAAMPKQVCCA